MERGTLRDLQIVDLAFTMIHPRVLNLSDPGTGKTPPSCAWMSWLWTAKQCRTVWVMPKSLLKKNREELLKFSEFDPQDVIIIDGTPKKRALQMRSGAVVFLMGFKRWATDWDEMLTLYPDIKAVAVDEIHMGYGGHDSFQTQELYAAMRHIPYFLAMTGTLINGRLSSAYPAIHIIEPRYYAGYQAFLYQHAVTDFYGKICGWKNHDKLAGVLQGHSVRHSFEEVFGKEAKITQIEEVEMSERQRAAYDEFEKTALLELDDAFLSASMPGVAAIRCRQILGHPDQIPHPSGLGTYDLMGKELTGKDERLLIHIEDHLNSGKPLVIFASLIPEMERIHSLCKKAGLKVGLINGKVSAKNRAQVDEDFRAGKLDGIVGSPMTASVGFNWGHCDHVIFASLDYMDSSYIQAYRRMIRGIRTTPLLITVLEYARSIERRIFQIVQSKSESAHLVDETYQKLELVKPKPTLAPAVKKGGVFSLRSI
jgi:hypothetical protein